MVFRGWLPGSDSFGFGSLGFNVLRLVFWGLAFHCRGLRRSGLRICSSHRALLHDCMYAILNNSQLFREWLQLTCNRLSRTAITSCCRDSGHHMLVMMACGFSLTC